MQQLDMATVYGVHASSSEETREAVGRRRSELDRVGLAGLHGADFDGVEYLVIRH